MFVLSARSSGSLSTARSSSMSEADELDSVIKANSGPSLEGNLRLLDTLECPAVVMCCRFSKDGRRLAVGLADGSIKVFGTSSSENSQMLYSLVDDDTLRWRLPVTQIRFTDFTIEDKVEHTHILRATYASGHVKFWHYTSGKCIHTIHEVRQVLTTCSNPQNTLFLTAGADPEIHIYDEDTKKKIRTCKPSDARDVMDGHRFRVFAAQWHPSMEHVFISGGWDDTVQYWDDRQQKAWQKLIGPHICGDALDIDPLHNHIITGSWRKSTVLQIWDFPTGRKIKDVPQDSMNQSLLYCAHWLGKDSIICGGCDHNMARVIDRGTLNTTGQLVDLPQGVYCIDNDRIGANPKIAIGAQQYIFMVSEEKRKVASDGLKP